MANDLMYLLGAIFVLLSVLAVGGFLADYVLPRIPFVRRYVDSLPEYDDAEA